MGLRGFEQEPGNFVLDKRRQWQAFVSAKNPVARTRGSKFTDSSCGVTLGAQCDEEVRFTLRCCCDEQAPGREHADWIDATCISDCRRFRIKNDCITIELNA